MDENKIKDALERMENEYNDGEEELSAVLEELNQLHRELWDQPELLHFFRTEASISFGGKYIPYLFWPTLSRFLTAGDNREMIFELVKDFTTSDFDEQAQQELKPLLVIYFASEKAFELDKLKSFVVDKAHPLVREYFDKLINFVSKNQMSVQTYQAKFKLLKDQFPDFELFEQPVSKLEEEFA